MMTTPPRAGPSAARQRIALAWGAFGTMLDVALVVIGSALLGLAIAVLLDGFDLVSINLGLSTGAMLGSSLVIGIVGGFALGVASEGPLGRSRRSVGLNENHVLLARVLAVVVVGLILMVVRNLIDEYLVDLPVPFEIAGDIIQAVSVAGMTVVPLLAVPLAWWMRSGGFGSALAVDGDIPLMYLIWAIATMFLL